MALSTSALKAQLRVFSLTTHLISTFLAAVQLHKEQKSALREGTQ